MKLCKSVNNWMLTEMSRKMLCHSVTFPLPFNCLLVEWMAEQKKNTLKNKSAKQLKRYLIFKFIKCIFLSIVCLGHMSVNWYDIYFNIVEQIRSEKKNFRITSSKIKFDRYFFSNCYSFSVTFVLYFWNII